MRSIVVAALISLLTTVYAFGAAASPGELGSPGRLGRGLLRETKRSQTAGSG